MSAANVHLFTDIEGSTRLWEQQPERMRAALAAHDALARAAVQAHGGRLVKTTGDGLHAVFAAPGQALCAALQLQHGLQSPEATAGLALAVRCGLHAGVDEARDNDFYGREVNRAARIMSAAHGGQVLVSEVVAQALVDGLPCGVQLLDLGLVRLRDLPRAERVFQVQADGLRQQFPALAALAATPHNLPQRLNRFIGRADALARLRDLLASHRLVTLWGPGGIGKSRLSVELGHAVLDDFADGVWLVELAPLTDADRVAQAVAAVLGVKESTGQRLDEALADHVRDRRMLLILDNCEHVHGAAAELAKQLLGQGAGLRVLASSREVLRVAGEQAFAVPALSTPAAGQALDADQLMRHDAVRLFVDRASAALNRFQVDAANAPAVAEICGRLDGLPLAIELVAARVRSLPVAAIAERLRASFALVATHDATVAPRQRTLQLLIDWSHDLLSPAERMLYRRLALFAGGFDLDAAEQVCGDHGLPADQLLDLLGQLVEKSLVAVQWSADGALSRYRLLDTVQRHADGQLASAEPAPALAALRRSHAAWAMRLAEAARPHLAGPEQADWLARLDADRENLLAALAWCTRADHAVPDAARTAAECGLRLSFALRPYWINRGLAALGLAATRAVLDRPGARPRDALRARGLFDAGQLCSFTGRYAEALQLLGESLAIARETGDTARQAAVLQPMGMAALGLGDRAAARHYSQDAVDAARALDNPRQLAGACTALAQLDRMEGRLDAAEALYQEFMQLARALGDPEYVAIGLLNLAMVALGRGRADRVPPMLLEVMAIADANGSRPAALCALDVGGALAAQAGDWPRAARWWGLAEAHNRRTGLKRDAADEAFLAPLLRRLQAALGADALALAEQAARELPFDQPWEELRRWLQAPAATAPAPPTPPTPPTPPH